MKQNIPANLKGAYSCTVLFTLFPNKDTIGGLKKTDNLRALKFLQSVLPIMMN